MAHRSQGECINSPRAISINPALVQAQFVDKRLFQSPRGGLLNNVGQFMSNQIARSGARRNITGARRGNRLYRQCLNLQIALQLIGVVVTVNLDIAKVKTKHLGRDSSLAACIGNKLSAVLGRIRFGDHASCLLGANRTGGGKPCDFLGEFPDVGWHIRTVISSHNDLVSFPYIKFSRNVYERQYHVQ
jgi:hypothetical protein